jgi:23S rRNA pseudouridine1911/1915/1917 synthase
MFSVHKGQHTRIHSGFKSGISPDQTRRRPELGNQQTGKWFCVRFVLSWFSSNRFVAYIGSLEKLFTVIHESDDLLVINKPAGLVCHPTKTDEYSSLISRVRLYLGGDARPHLVNRLDRETSGVTLVAKHDDAARELRRIWEERMVAKEYLAIVHNHVREDSGLIDVPLGRDELSRVAIKDCVRPDGLPSQTRFQVTKRFTRAEGRFTLATLHLLTGRKHQIRIHLAHIGHPIVGDKIYGLDENLYLALVEGRLTSEQKAQLILPHQALHAEAIRLMWREQPMEFRAEPEAWFTDFLLENRASPGNDR